MTFAETKGTARARLKALGDEVDDLATSMSRDVNLLRWLMRELIDINIQILNEHDGKSHEDY